MFMNFVILTRLETISAIAKSRKKEGEEKNSGEGRKVNCESHKVDENKLLYVVGENEWNGVG